MAKVQPHPTAEYTAGSASHPILPATPLRGIILAPSGGGKTVLLVSLLLDMYRGAFARIYVFSRSVDIDAAWRPVKEGLHRKGFGGRREEGALLFQQLGARSFTAHPEHSSQDGRVPQKE